jgi:Putative Ig domain
MKALVLPALCVALGSVAAASVVGITSKSVPNGTINTAYSGSIKASGGCTPYSWKIVSGALPIGVTKKSASNTTILDLTGTPTREGSYSFTVAVTGCGHYTSQASFKIVVQGSANHVVDLKWKASSSKEVAGYNVYRAPSSGTFKKINVSLVASTAYSDSTVANGSTYYYAATAVGIDGKESAKTASIKVVVP